MGIAYGDDGWQQLTSGLHPLEKSQHAISLEYLPRDRGRIPVGRRHLAHRDRRRLQLRLDDLQGIRNAGRDGAGGATGKKVVEFQAGRGDGARGRDGRAAPAGGCASPQRARGGGPEWRSDQTYSWAAADAACLGWSWVAKLDGH